MRKGYFKRIDPTPYKVRLELTGPVTIVYPDQVIYADVATFKDVIGFEFVGWTKPADATQSSSDPAHPIKVSELGDMKIVAVQGQRQAPHKVFLENLKKEKESKKEEPTVVKFVEESEPQTPQTPPPPSPTASPEDKENDKKLLIECLSKFDQKKWFIMKKDVALSYLDRLGVDYSLLPNSKNEYIKCLRDYIKSLG
jgi:hypothetical protein